MSESPHDCRTWTIAHVAPFAVFMSFLAVLEGLQAVGFTDRAAAVWWRQQPELWLYPVQTVVTLAVLVGFWKHYQFRPYQGLGLAVIAGLLGIAVWIAPGFLYQRNPADWGFWQHLGFSSRDGSYPAFLATTDQTGWYWLTLSLRFLRLVVAVPLAEEIFWRGFLMRYLVDPQGDYRTVPFGTFDWRSLLFVTGLFVAAHASVDYFAAMIFGLLMYGLAVRTRSLAACVVMHAVANLVLGLYVLQTHQWGYW